VPLPHQAWVLWLFLINNFHVSSQLRSHKFYKQHYKNAPACKFLSKLKALSNASLKAFNVDN
jgi:hypothetical protein